MRSIIEFIKKRLFSTKRERWAWQYLGCEFLVVLVVITIIALVVIVEFVFRTG